MAGMRDSMIVDGRPLSGEERSCSGHHRHDRVRPTPVMSRIEIPQRSSLLPYWGVLSFLLKHGRHRPVKRRSFISLLGGAAAACPLAARAQQSAMPIVGFMHATAGTDSDLFAAFKVGLRQNG